MFSESVHFTHSVKQIRILIFSKLVAVSYVMLLSFRLLNCATNIIVFTKRIGHCARICSSIKPVPIAMAELEICDAVDCSAGIENVTSKADASPKSNRVSSKPYKRYTERF